MKGFKGLLINELIKIRRQKSFTVALCIILVLGTLLCVLFPLSYGSSYYTRSISKQFEWYEHEYEYCVNEGLVYEAAYYSANIETVEMYTECGVEEMTDWRWKYSSSVVLGLFEKVAFLNLYQQGYRDSYSLYSSFYSAYTEYVGADMGADTGIDGEVGKTEIPDENTGELELDFDVNRELEALNAKIDGYRDAFEKNDTYTFHKNAYESQLEIIEETEILIKEAESRGEDTSVLQTELDKARRLLPFYKLIMEKNADIGKYSWEYVTLELADNVLMDRYSEVLMTEREFAQEENVFLFGGIFSDYGKYKEAFEYYTAECDKSIDTLLYSLENGIPTKQALENSARSNTEFQISILMNLIAIFAFMLFGSVMANEFTQGTVRLLLIRPRKRYKILTAKLVACTVYVTAASLVLFAVSFTVNAIVYRDAFVPYLYVIGGDVVRMPSVLVLLARMLLCLIPLLAISAFSVLLSLATKRSVLSVALPMLVYFASPLIRVVTVYGFGKDILKYFIGTNLNLSDYMNSSLDTVSLTELSEVSQILFGIHNAEVVPMAFVSAAAVVLVSLAAGLVGSYILFNKTEVKS